MKNFSAIILAAGYSSRMGKFKALLPIGEKRVIDWTLSLFQKNGLGEIIVITGHRSPEIREHIRSFEHYSDVKIVENPDYDEGMFSSVKSGVGALDEKQCEAFFIMPSDICLARPLTVKLLKEGYKTHPGNIIHPCFNSKLGHPPLIPALLIPDILESNGEGGLKAILQKHEARSTNIQTPDRHMLIDMDRPEDYEYALLRFKHHDIPTADECDVIFKVFSVSENIIQHSRKVEEAGLKICKSLKISGINGLNCKLMSAAALLHDIAKGRKNHAGAGARMLADMGFRRVAEVVAQHTDLNFKPDVQINEAELLYIADKLVIKDRFTTLEERFENALNRFGHEPEARAAISRRKEISMKLRKKLERALGQPLDSLF